MSDAVRGNLGTANTNLLTRIRAVLRQPAEEEPEKTPLLVATRKLRSMGQKARLTARGWKMEWMTQARFLRYVTVSTTAPGTGVSIVLTDISYVQPNHLLQYQDELIFVSAVNTGTNTLTVVRDLAGQGKVSIPANVKIALVSHAAEQGADKGPRFSKNPTFSENVTQIIRRGTGITRTQMQTDQYHAADELEYQVALNKKEMQEEWERAVLMQGAAPQLLTGTENPIGIMAGLPYFIQTNRFSAGGSFTYEDLDFYMQRTVRNGGNSFKTLMGGQTMGSIISQFPAAAIRTTVQSKVWGREITRIIGPGWECEYIPNWQMDNEWSRRLYILDFEYLHYEPLQEIDLDYNSALPGKDAKEVEMIFEAAIIVENEKAHALIEDIDY